MNGGDALVETLVAHGVDHAFTVPGESFLTVLEALRQRQNAVRTITVRHESGATFAAEAFAKIAGRPAACFVSRGPGAANASIGVHTARQDSTPLLLFMGQVPRRSKGREAFQEIDPNTMFGSLAKAVLEPAGPDDVASVTALAVEIATRGRPGPVVVALPKDVSEGETPDAPPRRPAARDARPPEPGAIQAAAALVKAARRPLILAGEMVLMEGCSDALAALADAAGAPVMAAYRRQDALANEHPAYAGHLEINRLPWQKQALAEADVILAVGARLDGITVEDFTLIRPEQKLIHLYPDADALARWKSAVAIEAEVGAACRALATALPKPPAERLAWREGLHRHYLELSTPGAVPSEGAVDLAAVVAAAQARAPGDAICVTDGGSYARWVHRYWRFRGPRTQAGPISGAMGYGAPGAIGAQLARPSSPVLCFVGDGSFMMSGMELATAAEENVPIKVIVCDNHAHGSILTGQVGRYGPDAAFHTLLKSPDFGMLARAFGLPSWRVERTAEFAPAFDAMLKHPGPALLHLLTDRRDIVPYGPGKDAV